MISIAYEHQLAYILLFIVLIPAIYLITKKGMDSVVDSWIAMFEAVGMEDIAVRKYQGAEGSTRLEVVGVKFGRLFNIEQIASLNNCAELSQVFPCYRLSMRVKNDAGSSFTIRPKIVFPLKNDSHNARKFEDHFNLKGQPEKLIGLFSSTEFRKRIMNANPSLIRLQKNGVSIIPCSQARRCDEFLSLLELLHQIGSMIESVYPANSAGLSVSPR